MTMDGDLRNIARGNNALPKAETVGQWMSQDSGKLLYNASVYNLVYSAVAWNLIPLI